MNWIASDDYLALYFELNDEDLERVRADRNYFKDEAFSRRIQSGNGNNAHLFSLVIKKRTRNIRSGIYELLDKYKSVSWWTVKHRKFFIRRKHV